ncbi:MAG TPA: HEAT repeat domain-containing protein [Candidatus Elarobacter sp.]|nr:HEAT repeat domain-containing protein [Candidatus Elarobacter sp.]HEV2741242.1 HEAT repeat domain-containing protein [Candidatus Elarobacter sp.]
MLTLQIPMLLALLGTALMAVVIFAPCRVPAPVTTSFAPTASPPPFERWEPLPIAHWEPPAIDLCDPLGDDPVAAGPAWVALVDPRASACDAAARLSLVEALASVRTPWADAILRRALDDEPDPGVRAAVVAALGA